MTSVVSTPAQLDLIFKALASDHRRGILRMLSEADLDAEKTCCAEGELCACKISERLGLSPSTTSHHMSILREAGLVTGRKEGTWTYYTLTRSGLDEAIEALRGL